MSYEIPKNLFLVWLGENTVPPYHHLHQKNREFRRLHSLGWRIYVVCEERNKRFRNYLHRTAPMVGMITPEYVIGQVYDDRGRGSPPCGAYEDCVIKKKLEEMIRCSSASKKIKDKRNEIVESVMRDYYPLYLRYAQDRSLPLFSRVYYYLMELGEYAAVSDMLRYCCIYLYGGIYTDWDRAFNPPDGREVNLYDIWYSCNHPEDFIGNDVLVSMCGVDVFKNALFSIVSFGIDFFYIMAWKKILIIYYPTYCDFVDNIGTLKASEELLPDKDVIKCAESVKGYYIQAVSNATGPALLYDTILEEDRPGVEGNWASLSPMFPSLTSGEASTWAGVYSRMSLLEASGNYAATRIQSAYRDHLTRRYPMRRVGGGGEGGGVGYGLPRPSAAEAMRKVDGGGAGYDPRLPVVRSWWRRWG